MSSSFQLATQSTTGIGNSQDQVITSARPKAPVERNQPYIASSSTSSPATLGSIINSMRKPTLTLEEANQLVIQFHHFASNKAQTLQEGQFFENGCVNLRTCLQFVTETLALHIRQSRQSNSEHAHKSNERSSLHRHQRVQESQRHIDGALQMYKFLTECWARVTVNKDEIHSKEIREEFSRVAKLLIQIGDLKQPSKYLIKICLNELIRTVIQSKPQSKESISATNTEKRDHEMFWASNAKYLNDPTIAELVLWNLDSLEVGGKYFLDELMPNLNITPELLKRIRSRRMGGVQLLGCYSFIKQNPSFERESVFEGIVSSYVQNEALLFIPFEDFIGWLSFEVFQELLDFVWHKLQANPANNRDTGRELALVQYLVRISGGQKLVKWLDDGAIGDMFRWVAEGKMQLRVITPLVTELLNDRNRFGGLWELIREKVANKYIDIIQLRNANSAQSENAYSYIMKL